MTMDTDKYNPIKKEISNDNNTSSTNTGTDKISGSEFGSWQDSAPVMRLSAFLRANRDAGIRLCRRGDAPCLVFDPPLRRSDVGSMRLGSAEHAYDLAIDPKRDMAMMIRAGIITIDDIGALDDIDAIGSSA